MHILYLSQYFPPEVGATQARAYEMARYLVEQGHNVTMISEIPNHPSGVIPTTYQGKLFERVYLDGIYVIRLWVKTSTIKNFFSRMEFYLSYSFGSTIAGLLLRKEFDLIYATSPPLFVGLAGLALSHLRRLPLFFEVRDLWPESAVALGELRGSLAIRWATRLEEACYHRARRIVAVTAGIQDCLIERGIAAGKVVVVENGANVNLFQFKPEMRQKIRQSLGMDGKFLVVYTGIIGLAQGLEVVLHAADLLKNNVSIQFLMIGEGPKKAELLVMQQKLGLSNLQMLPEVPRHEVPDYLSAADLALIPLRNKEVFHRVLPSKLLDAWACERAVLLGVDGEARRLMESCTGGLFVPPEDAQALSQAILELQVDESKRIAMGKRGREFTVAHFSRQALARKLETILKNAT